METTEQKLSQAYDLLRAVLLESGIENEYDKDIYEFLKENNELPDENYVPYWE